MMNRKHVGPLAQSGVHTPRRRASQRGSALVAVVLVSLVVTALVTTLLVATNTDHMISANERDSERALFAAKAGLSYAYEQQRLGLLSASEAGTGFESDTDPTAAVSTELEGARFVGQFFDLATETGMGQSYRIASTGQFNRASRSIELEFQIIPEAFKFGYMAFNEATLHNHSGLAGPTFKIDSTIFSNNTVSIPENITIGGSIVAAGSVKTATGAVIQGDIFANTLDNDGTVEGNVRMVAAVQEDTTGTPDLSDNLGRGYLWYNGRDAPGSVSNGGTIVGTEDNYQIVDGDEFAHSIFRKNGTLMQAPNVNVTKYVDPPLLDYAAMKDEADENDATYFTSMSAAMTYLKSKQVSETIDGHALEIIKVGTVDAPEFLYIVGDFTLLLTGAGGSEDVSSGEFAVDGFWLEGGIYSAGSITINGPTYDPAIHPAGFLQVSLNALDYCFPALICYEEPSSGTLATWEPADTPVMDGGGEKLKIQSKLSPHEGFMYIHGVTYSQSETHCHHTKSDQELIQFVGAELGYKIHNCDYFQFVYDPAVRCTRFLVGGMGDPEVVSYREVR